jgi:predicted kinase
VAAGSDAAAQLYGTEMTQRTYGRLNQLAGDLLAAGVSVVVDAAALRQAEREALRATAGRAQAAFDLVDCQAPAAQMRSRIAERAAAGTDPSDATAAVLERQTAFAEPVPPGWAAITHRLVNDADLAALQARVQALAEVLAGTLKNS